MLNRQCVMNSNSTKKKREEAKRQSFVPPTPLTRSRFPVVVNKTHTILLFTTPNNSFCEKLIPTSSFIHLLQPVDTTDFDGNAVCMTEIVVEFLETGSEVVVLKYGEDERIYTFLVTGGNVKGPCESPDICQNEGVCFARAENNHKCMCGTNYTGPSCERGPCHNTNTCQNGGHCFVNNSVTTCVCKPGYHGQICSNDIVANTLHENTWPAIDRTSGIVRNISCIAGKECEVYAFVIYSSRPQVALGYTSKGIDANVEIFETDSMRGIYQVKIGMVSKLAVKHTVCLQTFDNDRTNKDEVCFYVNVTQDTNDVYVAKDKPHFVSPSLQSDSVVECVTGEQCRVSYTAKPGHGNETKCISASLSTDVPIIPFEHVIYSSCELCEDDKTANKSCTFDVVFVPTSYITEEKKICLTLSSSKEENAYVLLSLPQIEGEKRCFKVSNDIRARGIGCQKLQCLHGGFCDGHEADKPVCYCRKGYSGTKCEISSAGTNNNTCVKQFLGKNTLNFSCQVGETCSFPVEVCGANSMTMELAYNSALIDVKMDADNIIGINSCCQFRKVHVKANSAGPRMLCVQMSNSSGTIEDEVCLQAQINDGSPVNIDKTKPHFVHPTLPKTATFVCKVREVCHLLMHYFASDIPQTSSCPTLKDTSSNDIEGLHVFQPEVSNDYCVSDVSFNYNHTGTFSLCLQVSVPSKKGEERCFKLKVVEDANVPKESGHCKGITCFGKGVCVANFNNTQNCSCPEDHEGPECSIYQRSSPSVGAAAGGAVGGTLLAVILVMLWKYRKAFTRKPGEGARYDDLFNRQANVPAANTSSEYETCKVESQHTNQYETLAETSFHEYSVLSLGGKQDYSVRNRVTQVTETDRAVVNQENAYVNLSFSET
ncbi:uncharacterized protein LOC127834658 isoform X2 [Dreissena polymorpha]|nr:uncharacterized protein LOC127834658 isoform X2 [Dreissena polymorpha]